MPNQKTDGGWLLPDIINPSRKSFCISIPNEPRHVQAFFGTLQTLANWWEWQRDDQHLGTQVAQVWRSVVQDAYDSFLGEECMPPCDCPPMVRIGENGQLQYSDDNGETWQDAPLPPYIPQPPREGNADRRCLASRNAVEVYRLVYNEFQKLVDEQVEPIVVLAALISLIGALILFPPSLPAIWQYFTSIFAAFEALSTTNWGNDITDELTCILYCNSRMQNGVVTFDFVAIETEVAERALVEPFWFAVVYLLNICGHGDALNRAASTTSITAYDCSNLCSGCGGEWCAVIDFSTYNDNFDIVHGQQLPDGIHSVQLPVAYPFQQAGRQSVIVSVELPTNCQVCGVLDVELTFDASINANSGGFVMPDYQQTNGFGQLPAPAGDVLWTYPNNTCKQAGTHWIFAVNCQSTSVGVRLNKIRVFGNGLNPFWDNSCQPILG